MSYYLVKMNSLSVYWNVNCQSQHWNMPSDYYKWRNAMSAGLQNFSMNNEDFEFGKSRSEDKYIFK